MTDALVMRDGEAWMEEVRLETVAEEFGTPSYVYSAAVLRDRYSQLVSALGDLRPLICYAVKANPALGVIATLARMGAGADVVSGGELARALAAGVPADRIVFAGVGKSAAEIRAALAQRILQLNVESLEELAQIDALAKDLGLVADVGLRLNPDVAASTHDKISTGRRSDKFGIGIDRMAEIVAALQSLDHVRLVGLHCHIGSQIGVIDDFERAYSRMAELVRAFRAAGFAIARLNLGGGFGVRYRDEPALDIHAFAAMTRRVVGDLDVEVLFEPGRYLVASAGVLLSRSLLTKSGSDGRRFLVLDAGMNTLLRPAMYGAVHPIHALRWAPGALQPTDVVGPICESSDVFVRDYALPAIAPGGFVAIGEAGAYGAAMASDYNSKGLPAELLVDGDSVSVLRPRRDATALMADETIPAGSRAEGT